MTNKVTQRARVLDYLKTHDGLTVMEAVSDMGILSLPKRIEELRKAGHPITLTYKVTKSGARYGVYALQEGGADV